MVPVELNFLSLQMPSGMKQSRATLVAALLGRRVGLLPRQIY